jgi:hypothetical protein
MPSSGSSGFVPDAAEVARLVRQSSQMAAQTASTPSTTEMSTMRLEFNMVDGPSGWGSRH